MKLKPYFSLLLWIVVYLGVASVIGNVTKVELPDWYATLVKPALNPPNMIFPIMWTTLYIMMAIAGWRIWARRQVIDNKIVPLFAVQTLVNWAWSFFFFKYHMLGFSFGWLLLLVALVAWLICLLWKNDRIAAYLLIPYLGWISFASYLNGMIWHLN